MVQDVEAAVARAFRGERGRVVATLIGLTGDWDVAEECAHDAFAQALARWPATASPRVPGAWLTTTARNRAMDRLRRAAVGAAKLEEVAVVRPADGPVIPTTPTTAASRNDRLRLIFTCCHPALSLEVRVALTLRTLAGLTTVEIARAFLVPRGHHGAAARAGQAQDRRRRHPLPRASRPLAARPHRGGAGQWSS